MKFTILENKENVSFAEINSLAAKVGWGEHYFSTRESWNYTLEKSAYIAYIKKDQELIGFVRVLKDGQMCTIYDMCVHPWSSRLKNRTT